MKAEHRKELETNTLADRMGQAVQRVKTGRRSTFLIYVLVVVAVLIGLWFVYVTMVGGRQETSDRWIRFDDGGQKNLVDLATKEENSSAGKAARLELAWIFYWDRGVKFIGTDANGAMQMVKTAGDLYRKLAEDCKDDVIFEPQALLGIAVVEETKAVQDRAALDKAADAYRAVFDKYVDTAEGKYAKNRFDELKDAKKRIEIAGIYEDLQKGLGIRAMQGLMPPLQGMPGLPEGHPIVPVPKK